MELSRLAQSLANHQTIQHCYQVSTKLRCMLVDCQRCNVDDALLLSITCQIRSEAVPVTLVGKC
eukprot:scaffold2566_cov125-Alexandrium_tamarense.AAC.39